MKKVFIVLFCFFIQTSMYLYSQNVGINNDASQPDASAMLDVKSTAKGMLIPRMQMSERDLIASPATGLMIYQTDNTPGFYYYNGSSWISSSGSQGLSCYGYIYNIFPQVVAIESDVAFSSNGILSGLWFIPSTSTIIFQNPGVYSVWFSVSGIEPNQFALCLNGLVIPESIYGSGAGTQINSGMVIINASFGDILTLRNHISASAVTLQFLAGGTQLNVNASIMIQKIN
jgi:hypothetical protein